MKRFFIYSLPRSGTSWLANWFTWRNSFCYHEPFADGNVLHLRERATSRPEAIIGAIDTTSYLRSDIQELFEPHDSFVLIRSYRDIQRSVNEMGIKVDCAAEFDKLMLATKRMRPVFYEQLASAEYRKLLWMTVIGEDYDEERTNLLWEMNVQRSLSAVSHRARISKVL